MTEDSGALAQSDQDAQRLAEWHERNVPGVGLARLDREEISRFVATDPTQEEAQAYLRGVAERAERERADLAALDPDQ